MEKYNKNIQNISCKDCDYNTSKLQNYNTHLMTLKHKKNTLAIQGDKKVSSNETNYICCNCNYNTNTKCNYNKHLLTEKHKKKSNGEPTEKKYTCTQCNKEYTNYKSLWKHKKHCVINDVREPEQLENTFTPQLIMEVFKQSKGIQEFLVEQNRELQNKLLEKETELHHRLLEKENQLLEKENQLLAQNEEHHKQIIELISRQISNININT